MHRRLFLRSGAASAAVAATAGIGGCWLGEAASYRRDALSKMPPAASIEPVVADGRWISRDPPVGEEAYFDPRRFAFAARIELEGTGTAQQILATTPIPVGFPEQTIESVKIETSECRARIRQLGQGTAQLLLAANTIRKGQRLAAVARLELTLRKDYRGFDGSSFPREQSLPKALAKPYLSESPGIQVRTSAVRKLAAEVTQGVRHPWEKARQFHDWSIANIAPLVGDYTSVTRVLKSRQGDCEERAAVFVALCRSSGIPARLVWVPQHNWAEFYLVDQTGRGSWIPSHTAAYLWFGWTGVHELVLQKGDRVRVPEKPRPQRLQGDWMQWKGARPKTRFTADLTPLPPSEGGDTGPGARRKDDRGRWHLVRRHEADRYGRSA